MRPLQRVGPEVLRPAQVNTVRQVHLVRVSGRHDERVVVHIAAVINLAVLGGARHERIGAASAVIRLTFGNQGNEATSKRTCLVPPPPVMLAVTSVKPVPMTLKLLAVSPASNTVLSAICQLTEQFRLRRSGCRPASSHRSRR